MLGHGRCYPTFGSLSPVALPLHTYHPPFAVFLSRQQAELSCTSRATRCEDAHYHNDRSEPFYPKENSSISSKERKPEIRILGGVLIVETICVFSCEFSCRSYVLTYTIEEIKRSSLMFRGRFTLMCCEYLL